MMIIRFAVKRKRRKEYNYPLWKRKRMVKGKGKAKSRTNENSLKPDGLSFLLKVLSIFVCSKWAF